MGLGPLMVIEILRSWRRQHFERWNPKGGKELLK